MGRFAQKHPGELTVLVAEAVAKGAKAPQVQRQLAAGTFPGWDSVYQMPLETIRYYGKREKQRRAANSLSQLAKGDPSRGIDHLARQLFAEAEIGIEQMRLSKARDPEALKKWGDALKVIGSLLRPEELPTKGKAKRDKPSDPLTSALTNAASEPVPDTPSRRDGNGKMGEAPSPTPTIQPTSAEPAASAGLPQVSVGWPFSDALKGVGG